MCSNKYYLKTILALMPLLLMSACSQDFAISQGPEKGVDGIVAPGAANNLNSSESITEAEELGNEGNETSNGDGGGTNPGDSQGEPQPENPATNPEDNVKPPVVVVDSPNGEEPTDGEIPVVIPPIDDPKDPEVVVDNSQPDAPNPPEYCVVENNAGAPDVLPPSDNECSNSKGKQPKVLVCHKGKNIIINLNGWCHGHKNKHLGDRLGSCAAGQDVKVKIPVRTFKKCL